MKFQAFIAALSSVLLLCNPFRALRPNIIPYKIRRLFRIVFVRSWVLLYNFAGHLRLTNILLSHNLIELVRRHPKLTFKYLGGNYLARSMSARTRLAILTHHYAFVRQRMQADFAAKICDVRPVLWQTAIDGAQLDIRLSFPYSLHHPNRTVDHEGDLAVTLHLDGLPLYVMCLTIAPAGCARLPLPGGHDGMALFIGRIQGADGRFDQIRQATKLMHEVSPKDALFAAVQGLAGALEIRTIVGVSTDEQLSRRVAGKEEESFFDYDKFWETLGASRTEDNLFALPLPLQEKPIEMIAQKHKGRTLRKRAFKKQICAEAGEHFAAHCLKPARAPASALQPALGDRAAA